MSIDGTSSFEIRRNSFKILLRQLHPRNRPERGGTLRPENDTALKNSQLYPPRCSPTLQSLPIRRHPVPHPPLAPQRIQQAIPNEILEKVESIRRQDARRSFRESEDYLGVQGVNPRTGRKDPSAATTDTVGTSLSFGSMSVAIRCKMEGRKKEIEELRAAYMRAKQKFREEWERHRRETTGKREEIRRRETERIIQRERNEKNEAEHKKKRREAKWMLDETGWNSVFSPEITPVPTGTLKGDYFGQEFTRPMSFIVESPCKDLGNVESEMKGELAECKGLGRRCRRHRRSFK